MHEQVGSLKCYISRLEKGKSDVPCLLQTFPRLTSLSCHFSTVSRGYYDDSSDPEWYGNGSNQFTNHDAVVFAEIKRSMKRKSRPLVNKTLEWLKVSGAFKVENLLKVSNARFTALSKLHLKPDKAQFFTAVSSSFQLDQVYQRLGGCFPLLKELVLKSHDRAHQVTLSADIILPLVQSLVHLKRFVTNQWILPQDLQKIIYACPKDCLIELHVPEKPVPGRFSRVKGEPESNGLVVGVTREWMETIHHLTLEDSRLANRLTVHSTCSTKELLQHTLIYLYKVVTRLRIGTQENYVVTQWDFDQIATCKRLECLCLRFSSESSPSHFHCKSSYLTVLSQHGCLSSSNSSLKHFCLAHVRISYSDLAIVLPILESVQRRLVYTLSDKNDLNEDHRYNNSQMIHDIEPIVC